jgi:protein-S-isoprenylcysteine O-methyltransferase Ste14
MSPDSTISFCAPVLTVRRRTDDEVSLAAPTVEAFRAAPLASRVATFIYGVACYGVFFATFLYAFGWVANILTPTALDAPRDANSPLPWVGALALNLVLLLVFAVQHSVMARPWFKAWWTRYVPEPAERSTYVLLSSLALIVMFALWQPLGGVVWNVEQPVAKWALTALMGAGWLLVLYATFLINHFDLFGLRQVWLHLRGKPYTHLPFKTPGLYKVVRHPLYVGWFVAFWATPSMTGAHLVFAVVTTVYILAAIRWEEKDLSEFHGEKYRRYREDVPMLVPGSRAGRRSF